MGKLAPENEIAIIHWVSPTSHMTITWFENTN